MLPTNLTLFTQFINYFILKNCLDYSLVIDFDADHSNGGISNSLEKKRKNDQHNNRILQNIENKKTKNLM
jgi:hypothetical protein